MSNLMHGRRALVLGPLLTALATSLGRGAAEAAGVDASETVVELPDHLSWRAVSDIPATASEQATLFGATDAPGQYLVLVRWHPGFMSAPHVYDTDRLCVVVSGTWFVASGTDFAPESTVPVPAGSFVRRVARTPHYDGVRKGAAEPAVIAITGMAPIGLHLVDPSRPLWRTV